MEGERHLTRGRRDEVRKADDGWRSGILFSSIVEGVMQRVVPCSNWCASTSVTQIHHLTRKDQIGHVEYRKAQCGETRPLRLDGGVRLFTIGGVARKGLT